MRSLNVSDGPFPARDGYVLQGALCRWDDLCRTDYGDDDIGPIEYVDLLWDEA